MVCYSKSVIYKLVCNTNELLIYVGSTCSFTTRKSQHKSACNNSNNKAYNYPLYKMIRDNGGWDNFRMVIIEEYPCENKTQLCIREEQLRVEYKANMNACSAFGLDQERRNEYTKKYRKEHYKQHKEENKEICKKYYNQNKEKIIEQKKEHYKQNKEKITEYKTEQVTCECGCIISTVNLSRHKNSKKHIEFKGVKKAIQHLNTTSITI
jgi:hypothetical protein